jgi:hypothetical protein
MKNQLKVGDKVRIMDPGLLMLQKFAPPGAKPNNEGTVAEIWEDGDVLIDFPLEGENHSQSAPYPANICQIIN